MQVQLWLEDYGIDMAVFQYFVSHKQQQFMGWFQHLPAEQSNADEAQEALSPDAAADD